LLKKLLLLKTLEDSAVRVWLKTNQIKSREGFATARGDR
jgi:hypothetical protein